MAVLGLSTKPGLHRQPRTGSKVAFGTQLLTEVELLEGADNDGLPNGLGVFGTEILRMFMLKSDKLGMLMLGIEGGGREIEGMERVGQRWDHSRWDRDRGHR